MKKMWYIGLVLLALLPWALWADDFVDDTYYSPEVELSRTTETGAPQHEPYYNKRAMQELVFVEDTIAPVATDTIQK